MKDAKANIDFVGDKIEIFGSDLDIICSTSRHYCILVFSFKHIDHENKSELLLSMNNIKGKEEKCKSCKEVTQAVSTPHVSKTYRTTEKCWHQRQRTLCNYRGNNEQMWSLLEIPKKAKQRPVVGFSLATEFNECVIKTKFVWFM